MEIQEYFSHFLAYSYVLLASSRHSDWITGIPGQKNMSRKKTARGGVGIEGALVSLCSLF